MFTENMSDQDWRIASMLMYNANYVRKQKETSEKQRHQELLEEQRRASQRIGEERRRADKIIADGQSMAQKAIESNNAQLLEQNRLLNFQSSLLQALPLISESDRASYIAGNLKDFFGEPELYFYKDIWSKLESSGMDDFNKPIFEEFQKRLPREVAKEFIEASSFCKRIEAFQLFLPPQFRVSVTDWSEIFVTPRLSAMIRLIQLEPESAMYCAIENNYRIARSLNKENGDPSVDAPLNLLSWEISSRETKPALLVSNIAYLAIIISLWNDNSISEPELINMISILRKWQPELTDDSAYAMLQAGVEQYNADLKTNSQAFLNQSVNRLCINLHPKQAAWVFDSLKELAEIEMAATDKQLEFLNLLKESYDLIQNEKHQLAAVAFDRKPATTL